MIKNLGAAALTAILLTTSCSDYLDKQPSISSYAPITSSTQLLALFDYTQNIYENNFAGPFMTDDCGMSTALIDAYPGIYPMAYYTAFDHDCLEAQSYDYMWQKEYQKIYYFNTIIDYSSKVEDPDGIVDEAKANALFSRAWSYYTLAQYYCRPYCEKNKSEMGLPLRLNTDFEEDLTRATLEETYNQIFADLEAADKLLKNNFDEQKRWRAGKCAVNAFYARLYLTMGDYQQALNYANTALASAPALYDYNNLKEGYPMSFPAMGDLPAVTLTLCETSYWYASQFLYFGDYIFARFANNMFQWNIPSKDLLESYDQENDLRYKWFMIPHSNRRFNCTYDEYRYNQFSDGSYFFSGLSTSELLLTKAECEVRLGNWEQGIKDLDELRAHRYVAGTESALTATSQTEALKKVLAERRREFPFSLRMADIKRYAVNETPDDDVTITRDFYEMTMTGPSKNVKHFSVKGDDPELVLPINGMEIDASLGQILQNNY